MSYAVGTHVALNPDGSIARPANTFQEALESTNAEVGTSYRFTPKGKLARVIPVIAL